MFHHWERYGGNPLNPYALQIEEQDIKVSRYFKKHLKYTIQKADENIVLKIGALSLVDLCGLYQLFIF